MSPSGFLGEVRASAERLMAAYPVTDLAETAQTAAKHLRTIAGIQDWPRRSGDIGAMHEAHAMYGVIHGDALADLGRPAEATRALDAAERHAFEIGHKGLLAWIAGTRAQGHIQLGDPDTALDLIGMALQGAKDTPGLIRLYTIAARAYALRGGSAEAMSALWLAKRTAEQHSGQTGALFGVPFRTMSAAEVACSAAETYAILGSNKRARKLAETWTPLADEAGHTALRGHFRGAHAIALASSDPEAGSALMAWQITEASALGDLGTAVHSKIRMFMERAAPTASVRDVADMYRTLSHAGAA
jgi:hypothetical protein